MHEHEISHALLSGSVTTALTQIYLCQPLSKFSSLRSDFHEVYWLRLIRLSTANLDNRELAFPTNCLFGLRFPQARCALLRVAHLPIIVVVTTKYYLWIINKYYRLHCIYTSYLSVYSSTSGGKWVYAQGPWLPNLELTMPNSRPISGTAHEVIDFDMLNFITLNNVL